MSIKSFPASFLRRYTELPFVIDYLQTKQLALPSPRTWDDRNDAYYIERYASATACPHTYALCLTQAFETYHHWRVFSHGSAGACIEFDQDALIHHALKQSGLRAEPVQYRTLQELRASPPTVQTLPFLKRSAFADEMEFRLFLAQPKAEKDGVYRLSVPVSAVKRIILSPWLPKSVTDRCKVLLKSMEGCKSVKIYRSSLVDNEEWKRYGDRGLRERS